MRATIQSSRESGLSLIELMVAVAIGAVLIFGATQVYVDSKKAYSTNETVARMQETARFALAVIEPDARMAGYLGLVKGSENIPNEVAVNASLSSVTSANVCGAGFIGKLESPIEGTNNAYGQTCAPYSGAGNSVGSADTLVVRRASIYPAALTNGTVQVCSTRTRAYLFLDGLVPTGCTATAPDGQINNLVVDLFYLDKNSTQGAGYPALRRKSLTMAGGSPAFQDTEIVPGIEDMQLAYGVELGVDPLTNEFTGNANRYVDAVTAQGLVAAGGQIVSVRIWLLVRSDTPEVGFADQTIYQYGDRDSTTGTTSDLTAASAAGKAYQPSLDATVGIANLKNYRRLLVSRTIQIRNASGT